jgi:hypothetical protein
MSTHVTYTISGIKDKKELMELSATVVAWMIEHPDTELAYYCDEEVAP